METGIALDLGTSGFRGQAVSIGPKPEILSTAITRQHPLPGYNVVDHLDFALHGGITRAQALMVRSVNDLINRLLPHGKKISRLAVCGNPIQLSIFQGMEIRDLAYAGHSKLDSLNLTIPCRDACILNARDIAGLELPGDTDVVIPPVVYHEIGADTLAMIIQSGMMEKDEIALATDFGTNAEMALKVGDIIYTGSTAAGPVIEGQQIESGMLALPGAICDLEIDLNQTSIKTRVLDDGLTPVPGDTVDPFSGKVLKQGKYQGLGITGTGVVALVEQGLKTGLIQLPYINTPDKCIRLSPELRFTQADLLQAGKAMGAFRAGHMALCNLAGIQMEKIQTAYLCGAAGTYVNPVKAGKTGFYPPSVRTVCQVGNTSLAMARDLLGSQTVLDQMQDMADRLKGSHCMFASFKPFSRAYLMELSHWTEGMPMNLYKTFLKKYGLSLASANPYRPRLMRIKDNDLGDFGTAGLKITDIRGPFTNYRSKTCSGCGKCIRSCPGKALALNVPGNAHEITIDLSKCNGFSCKTCEKVCPETCLQFHDLIAGRIQDHQLRQTTNGEPDET